MGRTLPTQIQILREAEEAWKGFRRALRKDDQASFDVVWSYARRHAMAASMAARPLPFEAQVLSMIIGLHREIQEFKKYVMAKPKEEGTCQSHPSHLVREIAASPDEMSGDDPSPIRGQNTSPGV